MTEVKMDNTIIQKAVNTIRFLSTDMVQRANSGHPGFPMGAAAIAYTIMARHLRSNAKNAGWVNRDRFVLSGGHGSAMLYSTLYLLDFLSMEDLKQFRQWGSNTPGHPEADLTPGVDVSTGPLGQGFANGIGMAIAESHLAATYNTPDCKIIDHYTYGIVTDGDLMEGVASEAASLAGHLKLGKIIFCYDDNRISIDGSTDLTFTEDRGARFIAYGWHVLHVEDGNDVEAIDQAIINAKKDPRPSLIICRTHIAFGAPHQQDQASSHGGALGDEELAAAKNNLGWPISPRFYVPEEVHVHFRQVVLQGQKHEEAWKEQWITYQEKYTQKALELSRILSGELALGWDQALIPFDAQTQPISAKAAAGKVLNILCDSLPEIFGGSADLTSSNAVTLNKFQAYSPDFPQGRSMHFGIREFAMGAILNGMAFHQGMLPFGATFMVFSDYLKPALRVAALNHLHTVWVMTHDSIYAGEDGPTHQPIEQVMSLRLIPNVVTIRPADANEAMEAWKAAVQLKEHPVVLALSRRAVPVIDRKVYAPAAGLHRGAYILADIGSKPPQIILVASGSEVELIIEAGEQLASQGYGVRLVSFPSWELFKTQDVSYKQKVLPDDIPLRLAVEAGVTSGWEPWIGPKGIVIGIDHFGASAPPMVLAEKFGFTVKNVLQTAKNLLDQAG
jgi:transketolase